MTNMQIKNYCKSEAMRNYLYNKFLNFFNYDYERAYLDLWEHLDNIHLIKDVDYVCWKYGKDTGYYKEICKDLFNHFYDNTDLLKWLINLIEFRKDIK